MSIDSQERKFYRDGFMDLTKYRMVRIEPGPDWDALVERSSQGTVFATSSVLAGIGDARPVAWRIFKDKQPVGGLLVVESADGRRCIENDYVIYGGPIFEPAPPEQSIAQTTAEQFRLSTFATQRLAEMYDEVFLALPPAFADIRPFLWHNYGEDGPHFVPDVRFTSLVRLDAPQGGGLDDDPLYRAASKSRRQQVRYGMQKGVVTEAAQDAGRFVELYAMTFARQGQDLAPAVLRQVEAVTARLLADGRGRLFLSRTADGRIGSAAVFGLDAKRAYYVFGANDPDLRDDHTGTMVLWHALTALRDEGVVEVDLEGVNSPLRGHFKLSFGGSVTPYYHLRLASEGR